MIPPEKIQTRRSFFIHKFMQSYPLYAHEAEDFGSSCVLLWLEKPDANWNREFKFIAIDYLRQRTQYSRSEKIAYAKEESLPEGVEIESTTGSPERLIEDRELGLILRSKELEPDLRCMLVLYYEYGFTLTEVADCFGVGEPRVSQRISGVQARVQKKIQHLMEPAEQSTHQSKIQREIPFQSGIESTDPASEAKVSFHPRSF